MNLYDYLPAHCHIVPPGRRPDRMSRFDSQLTAEKLSAHEWYCLSLKTMYDKHDKCMCEGQGLIVMSEEEYSKFVKKVYAEGRLNAEYEAARTLADAMVKGNKAFVQNSYKF